MNRRGFTLIEVIIYIALFSILMSGAVVATYQLLQGGDRNETAVSIQEEGTFLVRKINWALTSGTAANVSPDGATLTVTKLPGPDFSASDNPLVFSESAGTLALARGAGSPTPLNSAAFAVSNFQASTTALGGSLGVSVSFTVASTTFVFKTYLRQ